MTTYQRVGDEEFEVDVYSPGYGELSLAVDHGAWTRSAHGFQVGELLTAVAEVATGDAAPVESGLLPPGLTPDAARRLLPALVRAVVLAAAGAERYERVYRDETTPPPRPLCVYCQEGTTRLPGALPSQWCERHGHVAFGMGPNRSWPQAQEAHRVERKAWRRPPPPMPPADLGQPS